MSSSSQVVVIGSTGQLGTDLVAALDRASTLQPVALTHHDVEVTDFESVVGALADTDPIAVVNCAAFHRVDDCEDEPETAFAINAAGAFNVARAAGERDAVPVFISSDYVFDGAKGTPYVESDPVSPLSVYGVSKVAGESVVHTTGPALVARVSSLFGIAGASGKGGNFIETILGRARADGKVTVVDDIIMSPSYTRDVAENLVKAIETGVTGTLHLANEGQCSWHELASAAITAAGISAEVEPTDSSTYPSKARRPSYSALGSERDESLGITRRHWTDALNAYLVEKGHIAS